MADNDGSAIDLLPLFLASADDLGVLLADGTFLPLFDQGAGTPPPVTVISPPPGTPLAAGDQVTVEVVDDTGLSPRPLILFVVTPFATEVAFDGERFRTPYAGAFTPIAGGFRLSVRRGGGWQGNVTFNAIATDARGAEA